MKSALNRRMDEKRGSRSPKINRMSFDRWMKPEWTIRHLDNNLQTICTPAAGPGTPVCTRLHA